MPPPDARAPMSSPSAAIANLVAVLTRAADLPAQISAAGDRLVSALRAGGKILSCGNGGSATAALHLAEELLGRYRANRRPLPAVCLAADPATLTCIANDFGFDQIFARQLDALAGPADVLVAFSTSGNSPNILAALAAARARGAVTILVTGGDGGRARAACDLAVLIPSADLARVQEVHTLVLHCWLEQIEAAFPA